MNLPTQRIQIVCCVLAGLSLASCDKPEPPPVNAPAGTETARR
jgi:hypothetical protein